MQVKPAAGITATSGHEPLRKVPTTRGLIGFDYEARGNPGKAWRTPGKSTDPAERNPVPVGLEISRGIDPWGFGHDGDPRNSGLTNFGQGGRSGALSPGALGGIVLSFIFVLALESFCQPVDEAKLPPSPPASSIRLAVKAAGTRREKARTTGEVALDSCQPTIFEGAGQLTHTP
ncbi:MAG: hypothetical protein NZ899_06450 [Thermoguttaceae bacterium]|nr:hypothetical protein [Thermoguttaceae bacterium]MDW8079198.1 hypothetical protein [Thermoguttaceae bacterium]